MARDTKGRFTAGIEVTVTDRSASWIRRILRNFESLDKAGSKASKAFKLSADIKQSADNVAGFADDMARAVKKPIKTYMDFEEQLDSVQASLYGVGAVNESEMTAIAAKARKLGADTKFSALEAAEGIDILAKNFADGPGKAAKVLESMDGILDVAAASRESIATTSDIVTASMNQFGLEAADVGRIGDVLIKTANASATGLTDIGEAMAYAGVSAKSAGIDIERTAAMIGVLGDAGKKGSVAGTGLAGVLSGLQSGNKKQRGALKAIGINVADKKGNLKPIEELLAEMDKAVDKKFGKNVNGKRRAAWLEGLFGRESKEAAEILMDKAGSGALQAAIEGNRGAKGTAHAVAVTMGGNAAGAAKELDSSLEELYLTVGEQLIPTVTELLKDVKGLLESFTAWAKENPLLVEGIAAFAGGLALVGLIMAPIIKGIGAMITIGGGLIWTLGAARYVIKGLALDMGLLKFLFVKAMTGIKAAMIANPITAILVGIALAAALIYEYWEPITEFFTGLWDGVTASFKVAIDWIVEKIEWAADKVEAIKAALNLTRSAVDMIAEATPAGSQPAAAEPSSWMSDLAANTGVGTPTANDANYTADSMKENLAGWMPASGTPDFAAELAGVLAQGAPMLQPGQPTQAAGKFEGRLKIDVNGGQVTNTELTTAGEQPFEVRVNRGSQVAA
jgi:TP901 family phage tail tape measure protein